MNTQISSKLAALVVALMMNSLIIGAAAYLFNGQVWQNATAISHDHAAASAEVV